MILSGSATYYGNLTGKFKENSFGDLFNPYSLSKYMGEKLCMFYNKKKFIKCNVLRYFNVYGKFQPSKGIYALVIGIFLDRKKENKPLVIFGDGNQKRDFIHVYDLVEGLIKIADTKIRNSDGWELGTGINYSINELYGFFDKKFKIKSINVPDQPGNYRETLRINDDALKLLNWRPKDRLKQHIENLDTL